MLVNAAGRARFALTVATLVLAGAAVASSVALATEHAGAGKSGKTEYRLGRQAGPPEDAALISQLAVLRRSQTPADMLPAGLHVSGFAGTIIQSLTRLVASPPGANLYLVVSTPVRGSIWNPKLGDQVAIVAVTSQGAAETYPAPAADLTNGLTVELVGSTQSVSDAYEAGIVPDGVARVRWTFANLGRKRTYAVDVATSNNIAVTALNAATPFLLHATWYRADGSVIPTSDSALRQEIVARDNAQRRQIIRQDERTSFRPSPAILADFEVFSVTSRTGVRVGALTISHPRLSTVPLAILRIGSPRQRPIGQLDPEDMRKATTRAGLSAWIIPSNRGICVAAVDRSNSFPLRYGSGAGMGCSGNLARAESEGAGLNTCCDSGYSWNYGVVPGARPTTTLRTGLHTRRTVRLSDGVYIFRSR